MVTKLKKPARKTAGKKTAVKKTELGNFVLPEFGEGTLQRIALNDMDLCPLNYRKYYSQEDLENFAKDIAKHDVISPVTVRPGKDGRYELVVGERRWRGARIAGLATVLAVVREVTDEQVIEMQLAENIQRENPHPMNEAEGIGQLQQLGYTVDKIAVKLSKSKAYVFSRIKLLSLIPEMQELFLAGKISLQSAFEIARLSADSQEELFKEECKGWEKDKDFSLGNLSHLLREYQNDLKRAPFDPKSKTLLPDAGACTGCSFNSAAMKTLFPELAKESICGNRSCFRNKCNAHYALQFEGAFIEHQPAALLFDGNPSSLILEALEKIPDASGIPTYSRWDVHVVKPPVEPDKEDFWEEGDDEEETSFNDAEYQAALDEYAEDLEGYERDLKSEDTIKGLHISGGAAKLVYFKKEKQSSKSITNGVTAKQVQEALKSGTATPEMLAAEIERMENREARFKELDRIKVQEKLHEVFHEKLADSPEFSKMTSEDAVAARYIIYRSLDWHTLQIVDAVLFPKDNEDELVSRLASLSEDQYTYLIRMAVLAKPESKSPTSTSGNCLYQLASAAGIDVPAIESVQAEKAEKRQGAMELKKKTLTKKIEQLKKLKR